MAGLLALSDKLIGASPGVTLPGRFNPRCPAQQWAVLQSKRRTGTAYAGRTLQDLEHKERKSTSGEHKGNEAQERSGVGAVATHCIKGSLALAVALGMQLTPLESPQNISAQRGPATEWSISSLQELAYKMPLFPFHQAPALANGLLHMPPQKLNNDYYLVRAGESEWEAVGILHTNPVDKTNVQSGLSKLGKKQALDASRELARLGACSSECWLWPSISQRSYQTAEVIAYFNDLNYSRIVPEYSFLDARGVGSFENKPLSSLEELYELDSADMRIRPPRTTDGTPSESAHDVFVRVRQMMSVIETQYQGDTVIIVAPDSDNLSVLQAALTGLDLRSHHLLRFSPGEVRHVELPEDLEREPLISGVVKI